MKVIPGILVLVVCVAVYALLNSGDDVSPNPVIPDQGAGHTDNEFAGGLAEGAPGLRKPVNPVQLSIEEEPVALPLRGKRYVLPEWKQNAPVEDLLSGYWGAEWPRGKAKFAEVKPGLEDYLAIRNTRDPNGRPIGTIEDYFPGLDERAIKFYDDVLAPHAFRPIHLSGYTYLDPKALSRGIRSSSAFNPKELVLSGDVLQNLNLLIEEECVWPILDAEAVTKRAREMIREDVLRIASYGDPIYGKSFLSPLISNAAFVDLGIEEWQPYPILLIALRPLDWEDHPTEGGFFNGILSIWAGNDPELRNAYDALFASKQAFHDVIKGYFEGL